ncbi:hypothetical protein ANN_02381 [Periplaneta americana]|uniref:Uncharacterized protein n=1 Tax=Periplaneta americana TaxID=6978 RepID=A0ABQ8TYL5_PERAM|nr:hypothetical protein ANN_02381 [Periplaneta americana]
MSPGSSTESYPAFAHTGLRKNPGKNLNQVTCPDRDSNPGHLVSQPDALTVTPQNKVLGKIFGAKTDEVTGEWRKLHNAKLHALYSSPDIIRDIKFRRLRWAGHVARMGESRNAYRVWLFNDAVSTTRLFSVDEIGDSEMIFGEMRPRIRHRSPCIHIMVGENLGKNPTRKSDPENNQEEKKELVGSLAEKKPKDALEGMVNGRRVRGRRYQMIDDNKIYGSYEGTKRKAENKKDWRKLEHLRRLSLDSDDAVQTLGFTVFEHPPYSRDLATSDFHLFPKLKELLRESSLDSDEAVQTEVRL